MVLEEAECEGDHAGEDQKQFNRPTGINGLGTNLI
jgi:hypothetical protein